MFNQILIQINSMHLGKSISSLDIFWNLSNLSLVNHSNSFGLTWLMFHHFNVCWLVRQANAGPFRRFSTRVWQNARVNTVRRAMCILLFLKFYSFIKGIMRICLVFLKNLRRMFLDFTYYLVLIFITCNRTDVSLFKQVSK